MPAKKSEAITKLKSAEIEKKVIELAKQGESPAKIGLILRDKYGIPKAKMLGKKITRILKENNVPYLDEKKIIEKKVEKIKAHLQKNKQDHSGKRSLTKKLWAVKKLSFR